MKRTLLVLLSLVVVTFVVTFTAGAGSKKDGRPDGGSLSYGEYG